ncbi:MAG: DUF3037 domain-containing protein [Pseudomonadota bacterium]
MATTYKYSLIRVIPDQRRGEQVNVGIVVFGGEELDIRVLETRKAAAISSRDWDAQVKKFSSVLSEVHESEREVSGLIELISVLETQINLTEPGWFEARDARAYEAQIKRIITDLVKKPALERRRSESSIASKIAVDFKKANILSSHGEALNSGRVVRDYVVDDNSGLVAEFALQNGRLHLATTLSLTASQPHIGTAASKAVTMDKAKRANSDTKAYCVYSVAPTRAGEVKEHISLLGDYSDGIFNWNIREQRDGFKKLFFDAFSSNHPTEVEQRARPN